MKWLRMKRVWIPLAVLGGLILVGVGAAAGGSEAEIERLEAQVSDLEDDVEAAEEEADAAEKRLSDRQEEFREEQAALRREARQQGADLREKESELEAREEEVAGAEQELESNTIPDGIWQLGRDYEAGVYRAEGGRNCYWAKLRSANTNQIINNGFAGKNQTVEIDSPYFETDGCGDWTKIE